MTAIIIYFLSVALIVFYLWLTSDVAEDDAASIAIISFIPVINTILAIVTLVMILFDFKHFIKILKWKLHQ